jgi:ubiquinone/menaquinone biosynthesis C-methylase UbiE
MASRAASPRFFDLWSRFYDLAWVQRVTYQPVHDAVLRALRETGAARVLDVGCGTGLLAARLRRELPGTRFVGLDYSHGMLHHARERDAAVAWVHADALRLPLRDAAFDAVLSTEAFHWFPDQRAALAEFHRVLGPGGRILVALANPPLDVLSRVTHEGSRWLGQPLYWPTPARMRALVAEAGFRVERQQRIWRVPAGLLFPPVLTVAVRS